MDLNQIYRPIKEELENVEGILEASFQETRNKSILKLNRFLLDAPGKRLRPALVILSAKTTLRQKSKAINEQLIRVASSIELIHMASLIHDDVIDHSALRHHRPTVNSKWGQDASIALGDYLYSLAFGLISTCDNMDILDCISSATQAMCEGELIQVLERDNLSLLRQRYILIVKKKTASLFAASCQTGAMISKAPSSLEQALRDYGLNFGIAFQIIDDYLDIVGEESTIGKTPGQDISCGEITLPILHLCESVTQKERDQLKNLLSLKSDKATLKNLRERLFKSGAVVKTKRVVSSFVNLAKEKVKTLSPSSYRESLLDLADFIIERGFNGCWR